MSRWVGLREDQRMGEALATRIAGLFPLDSVWCIREQARSHIGSVLLQIWSEQHKSPVGAGLLAKRPVPPARI
ncbi:hypothetical protein C5612_08755 [Pseudomonas frederiksbergensis]|uniref:Uncharacterized protein n=1 Tax=Pseudomonas frederiksbergensis TaxID=104087 RepID=A0A2S8HRB0_9PSED|nr:hypothetical protein C5612_08755 [Pseudomonas frederiksbergensis]